ncbi:MAG TPA: hypothetical protein VLJ61_07685 [Pyrinomonadaceae bacterium]|nr:hypothetical protein [Pyrinomonadaceae bacterium]
MRNHVISIFACFIFACCIFVAACGSKTDVPAGTNAPATTGTPATTAATAKPAAPAESGVPVEFSKACSAENDKKTVEISGYLDGDEGVFCSETVVGGGEYNCQYRLKEKPADQKGIKANIKEGKSANQAEELSAGYERKDIKIHAADGQIINIADKVKLTGEMSVSSDGSSCSMKVTKVEK